MKSFEITKEQQLKGVSGWWNSDKIVKWDDQYDYSKWDVHTVRVLQRRLEKIIKLVKSLNLPQGAKVLELGYGAGQTACAIGKLGYEVHGIDISEKFVKIATERCKTENPEGKYFFKVGNIEAALDYEAETFDLVIISGVMHYLYDDTVCLKEVHHVLKPDGHLLLGQRTTYALNNFTSFRLFFCACLYFFLREKYELFHSYKAMLCDSKLRYIFGKFENTKLFNTKFMLKKHDVWKYKMRKKVYSNRRLKKACVKSGFEPTRWEGAYYCWSEEKPYYNFNLKVDDFFDNLTKKKFFHFLFHWARVTVVMCKKKGA